MLVRDFTKSGFVIDLFCRCSDTKCGFARVRLRKTRYGAHISGLVGRRGNV